MAMPSSALVSGILPLSHRRVCVRRRRQRVVVASWSSAGATPPGVPTGTRKPVASVVGAGIVGLTTALRLQEAGFDVTVTHAEDEHDFVSHGSGGFWFPYLVENMDRVGPWAKATYDAFLSEMHASPFYKPGSVNKDVPGGECVRMRDVLVFDDLPRRPPVPNWAPPDMRKLGTDELPPLDDLFDAYGVHISGGWGFRAPVVEMPGYLRALRQRIADGGGKFEKRQLTSLTDAAPHNADVVVNCAGLGNHERHGRLARDPALYPIRGQVVKVKAPHVQQVFVADLDGFTSYAIPRGDCVIIGGTHDDDEWDIMPDRDEAEAIMKRAAAFLPRGYMDNAEILGHWSGLRPARRGGARLELDDEPDGKGRRVVHCYGHGGAGVTCSWGCADEVVNICRECVKDTPMAVARPRVDDRDQSNNAVRTGADVRSSKSAQILKDWILKSVKKGGVAPTPKPQEPLPQER